MNNNDNSDDSCKNNLTDKNSVHNMTNILNIISSYSQLIELCTKDTENNHKEKLILYSQEIKNNIELLANIFNRIEICEKKY